MRFTWIALPLLFATLGGAPATTATAGEGGADEREERRAVVALGHTPVPAPPFGSARLELVLLPQGTSRRQVEGETVEDGTACQGPSSASARVHWRVMRVASLDFTNRLSHSVSGFLSPYSTACPPPRAA